MADLIKRQYLEIRFAGAGGQGLQAAATVLGKSLILSTDKYVCQSQNYGPESRGGLSYSDLIVSDDEIDFPKIRVPDVLICMSHESYIKFKDVIEKGQLNCFIYDPEMVSVKNKSVLKNRVKWSAVSATLASEQIFGNRIGANVVLVGALHAILGIGNAAAIEKVLKSAWPHYAEKNIAAFRQGMLLGKERK